MEKLIRSSQFLLAVLRKLISFWVKVEVHNGSAEQLKLPPNTPVCYVFRNSSLSDFLLVEQECIRAQLPKPSELLPNLTAEQPAHFFLTQLKGVLFKREDASLPEQLKQLIYQVQNNAALDVLLVPVSVFWGRSPDKELSALKLLFAYNFQVASRFKKLLTIIIHGRQTIVHFNPPMSLRDIVNNELGESRTQRKVARILRVHFRQLRTSVVGPDLSHRHSLVNSLLHAPLVIDAINNEVKEKGVDYQKAKAKAQYYGKEIASDFSYAAIRLLDITLTWFWNKVYHGIEVNHLEPIKALAKDHEIIYVPCHRSHIDYLLLSYVLFKQGLTPPHIAAGINLNMPVIGGLLRRSGAFFIRRQFKGNQLYTAVFNEYLHTLFVKGFPTEYFIEGGRSRTGRCITPKTGMLALTIRSYLRDNRRPIVFIPVYIGYENVLEVKTYLGELRGKSKKKESPLDVFRTLANLKRTLGKVTVNFSSPLLLSDFLTEQQPNWYDYTLAKAAKPEWLNPATNTLATQLIQRINAAASVNPVNLIAMALLSTPRQALDKNTLYFSLDFYLTLLKQLPYSEKVTLPDQTRQSMTQYVESMKLIHTHTDALGDVVTLSEKNAVVMTYYRNNILHLFALPSLVSCFFINSPYQIRDDLIKACVTLYPYLKTELFLIWPEQQVKAEIENSISCLKQLKLVSQENDKLVRSAPNTVEFIQLSLLAKAISQMLERFYLVISVLLKAGSETLDAHMLETQCQNIAQRLSLVQGINAPEFFDKTLFRNLIRTLKDKHVITIGNSSALCFDKALYDIGLAAKRILPPDIRYSILHLTESEFKPVN
ncbi:glycerol-3-phosphate 1-O-acyltransferase PlsB [Endozoicomonas sp. SM1973]|uniref:Glycerol-3-phosphate acyltransferase n=1 Tax=Spartinivicinus marinus TaxID=2994442 RepID=A0A853HVK8_9GAMM|nr:glycerol-3-phosphate 1-O-acyltransferase PlsB [Spartinivicinus marinus]MCX4025478.1 glycerol-3-phosphate 1-O-acyltransferase PlsB [Spartinivicinus marinus]NYZ65293.1 glycerol-3-phosphate 1-O-acyltransferase PlsB [Spartinivicinus marinus]